MRGRRPSGPTFSLPQHSAGGQGRGFARVRAILQRHSAFIFQHSAFASNPPPEYRERGKRIGVAAIFVVIASIALAARTASADATTQPTTQPAQLSPLDLTPVASTPAGDSPELLLFADMPVIVAAGSARESRTDRAFSSDQRFSVKMLM
jgi:hypothetical protein